MRGSVGVAAALLLAACGGGGGGSSGGGSGAAPTPLGAATLAVLVAEGDATGEAIAAAYQRARGLPAANIVRVPVPRTPGVPADVMSVADFATLRSAVDSRVPPDTQALLLTWTQPSRVVGACAMGITAALALGYDTRWCGECRVTDASPYYNSTSRQPWADFRIRPAMMLGATSLAEAEALIARGVAADGSVAAGRSSGSAWFVRTRDAARSVRWADFQAAAATPVQGLTMRTLDNAAGTGADEPTGQNDVLLYLTGIDRLAQLGANRYLPGAAGDSLTSFGGRLGDSNGQTTVREWLAAGLTGSFGTVEEPCALAEKFPRAAVLLGSYARGETLIEAYWKSVQRPGQGLFVGEPLAAPWRR